MLEKRVHTLAAFVPIPVADAIYAHAATTSAATAFLQARARHQPAAVLFADISGFTHLTDMLSRHGPDGSEELTSLLNLYFTHMIALLKRFGGQVIRFSGDALIALFPTVADGPADVAIRRATLQATYAAATMQTATTNFQHLPTSIGETALSLKIGIGAGEVLVAHIGGVADHWEYLIAGDPVTQMTNAEKHASPGMIMLSEQAAALVGRLDVPTGTYLAWSQSEPPEYDLPAPQDLLAPHSSPAWHNLSQAALQQAETLLHAYVPTAIITRLAAGQDAWLAELRRITMMFVGVGGLDYNHATILPDLQAFITTVQTIIARYEGSLNKVTVDDKGTVLLVLFGVPPLTHEDDPIRALACAQQLQASTRLRLAIGITSDTVFTGPVGSPTRREYTVIGNAVNMAARLMQAAGPGTILCDQTTAAMAQRQWQLELLPPLTVKGKVLPISAYRFAGQRIPLVAGNGRPLVNRTHELQILQQCMDVVEQGTGQVISLIGAGGMGKTRMAQEVLNLAQARRVRCLTGTASSTDQQTPYMVWREVLTSYFGFDNLPGTDQRAERVHEQVARLDPQLVARLPLLNDVLDLALPETSLTQNLDPHQRRDSLAFLVVELLLDWVQQQGLLLVLEDLQFTDSLSWELALDVARSLAPWPVLLLLSYRPLEADVPEIAQEPDSQLLSAASCAVWRNASQQALARLQHHHTVYLPPLDSGATARLATEHLGGVPVAPVVTDWLVERCQGNPFFVEETIKMLQERAALGLNELGVWQFTSQQQLTGVPPTLKGVIQARMDRLDPDLQLTCKVAAVVGRVFAARVIAGIHPVPNAQTLMYTHLDTLARLDITPREVSATEPSYRFKNALTQEVAYSSLLLTQRQALHEAVAEWYQHEYADDLMPYVPLLAHHYSHTERWHCHLKFSRQAGQLAVARYATTEALTYFSQAIDLLTAHPDLFPPAEQQAQRFELLLARAETYEQTNNYTRQKQDLNELHLLAEASGDPRQQALVRTRWARYYQLINDYTAAEQAAHAALVLAKPLNDRQLIGASLNWLARTAELRADYPQALWWSAQALSNCRLAGDAHGEGHSLNFIGSAYAELGDYDQAAAYHQRALAIRRTIEDHWGEASSLNQLGNLANNLGQPRTALQAYQEALAIRRRIGDRSGEAASLLNIGNAYQSLGDLSVAQSYQHEALTIWQSIGNQYGEAQLLVSMSTIASTLGDARKAWRYAAEAVELAHALGNRQVEGYGLDALGNASRGLDDAAAARQQHQAAYLLGHDLKLRRLEAYAQHHLGEWEWQWGQPTAAVSHWANAATLREQIGEIEFARASRARQAHALVAMGDPAGARNLAEAVWQVWGINPPPGEHEDELREAYLALYETWQQLDEPDRMMAALAWAYQAVQDRAVRISNPTLRASFLSRVPINQSIIAAWNALEHDGTPS